MCFRNGTPKKTFAKALRKTREKLELWQYFAKFFSILTTLRRGEIPSVGGRSPPRRVVRIWSKIREMQCISPYVREEVWLRNARYFADIIRTFPDISNYSQILFSHILAMLTLMPRVDNGLEMKLCAFSICSAALNDLVP